MRTVAAVRGADWVLVVTAASFIATGATTLWAAEITVLRLAVFGVPAWPVTVFALVEVAAALAVIGQVAERRLLVLLGLMAAARALLHLWYRDAELALLPGAQVCLVAASLIRGRLAARPRQVPAARPGDGSRSPN